MSSLEMDLVSCLNDSGEFFTEDGDNEFFSKSMATGMPGEESIDEKEQLSILNDLFGTTAIPGADSGEYEDFKRDQLLNEEFCVGEAHGQGTQHGQKPSEGSGSGDSTPERGSGKPVLSRRRSNPFYCPSRQIVDLVKKKRISRAPSLVKSQSSATVVTLNQLCGRRKVKEGSDRDR